MVDPIAPPDTVPALIARAIDAYADLETLGEAIDDEWTYVTDLASAWRERLEEVAGSMAEPAPPGAGAAVDRAIDEIGRIRDPHRAIDWLSTFPMVVLLAVGAEP